MSKPNLDDRELLELAAKAAGMTYLIWTPGASPIVPGFHRVDDRSNWSPLTDDGDALRLAVELRLFDAGAFLQFRLVEVRENPALDDCTLTRRAIVRAAAEIGKGMP